MQKDKEKFSRPCAMVIFSPERRSPAFMTPNVSVQKRGFKQHWPANVAAKPVLLFLLFWTVLNLLQIGFTELTSDEGYYWFYAQHLQWGYYDHPPLLALLIKWGSLLLPGELGVRFFNVILSTAGLWLFFTLLPNHLKQSSTTYLLLLSAPLLHYLTFLLFPDGPLLFFSLLFLVLYKRFLLKQNVAVAILLGFSLALMAYSKYHGALVLLFTVVANPKLLRSGYFYFSLLVAALLFLPHLWWQYNHDFPTLRYHLSGRTGQWGFRHVGEYLSQQVVAIGPGLIFLPFVCKANDVFERTLKFIIIGTFVFFLLSAFKTFVHFHWTSIALYPLLYFAVRYYHQPGKKRFFQWLIIPFAVLFFIARFLLMVPLIRNMHVGEDYYHGRKTWAKEVADLAGNRPLFMPNNLREASLYSYYTGKMGVTFYNRPEKKSQYELWGYEDSLQEKEVFVVSKYPFEGSSELKTSFGQQRYVAPVPFFQSYYSGVTIEADQVNSPQEDSAFFTLRIINHRNKPVAFNMSHGQQPVLLYSIEKENREIKSGVLLDFSPGEVILPDGYITKKVGVPVNGLSGEEKYKIYFGIRSGVLPDAWLLQEETVLRKE